MLSRDKGIIRSTKPLISILHRWTDLAIVGVAFWVVLLWQGLPMLVDYWSSVLFGSFLFYLINDLTRLYSSWRGENSLKEMRRVSVNWAAAFAGLLLLNYLLGHSAQLPDTAKALWFAVGMWMLLAYRGCVRLLIRALRARGYNTREIAIVGSGPLGQRLANAIVSTPWMGLNLAGFYDDNCTIPVKLADTAVALPISGGTRQLVADARASIIDKVYITLPMKEEEKIQKLVDQLSDTTASVYLIPDVFVFDLLHARSESINGLQSISIFDSPMDGANRVIKRLEDIVLSFCILALIAVPMIAIALTVRLTSSGPALFKQRRYGIDGKAIEVWKFRSMRVMENGNEVVQATKGDERITPFGAFLRRTSLDELPQFINVLLGDMSIVGPRPHAVAHNEEYRTLISGYMLRHKVKPGITGWAQVNGWRGETDTLDKMQKRIECDLDYIRHWSLWLDLKIVCMTIFKGFRNENAY